MIIYMISTVARKIWSISVNLKHHCPAVLTITFKYWEYKGEQKAIRDSLRRREGWQFLVVASQHVVTRVYLEWTESSGWASGSWWFFWLCFILSSELFWLVSNAFSLISMEKRPFHDRYYKGTGVYWGRWDGFSSTLESKCDFHFWIHIEIYEYHKHTHTHTYICMDTSKICVSKRGLVILSTSTFILWESLKPPNVLPNQWSYIIISNSILSILLTGL